MTRTLFSAQSLVWRRHAAATRMWAVLCARGLVVARWRRASVRTHRQPLPPPQRRPPQPQYQQHRQPRFPAPVVTTRPTRAHALRPHVYGMRGFTSVAIPRVATFWEKQHALRLSWTACFHQHCLHATIAMRTRFRASLCGPWLAAMGRQQDGASGACRRSRATMLGVTLRAFCSAVGSHARPSAVSSTLMRGSARPVVP